MGDKKLNSKLSFKKAAYIILKNRINKKIYVFKKYLNESSLDNPDKIRITIRKLRNNMELFISCYNTKQFITFYSQIVNLQDITGEEGDLDVLY